MSLKANRSVKNKGTKAEKSDCRGRKFPHPESQNSPVHPILFLQQTLGNHMVQGLLNSGQIQLRLKIGQPNDNYKQETDRVAEQILRIQDNAVISSQQSAIREDNESLRRKPTLPVAEDPQVGKGEDIIIQRQPEEEPEGQRQIEPPPNAITFDVLDPLNSSLRLGGFGLPSPRDIMNGLDILRQFGQPEPVPPGSIPIWPQPQLSHEEMTQLICTLSPSLCPEVPSIPQGVPPTQTPQFRLPPLRFRFPRLLFMDHKIIDHFIYDRSSIPDRHRLELDQTATQMIDQPSIVTDITGHTDTRGSSAYNEQLSERRANAVKDYMLNRRVPSFQIWTVKGVGETQPRFPNDEVDHLAASRNRRVELMLSRLSWRWTFFPGMQLQLRFPRSRTLSITDQRIPVLDANRAQYNELRDFITQVRHEINHLLESPPPGQSFVSSSNENITAMLRVLDSLLDVLYNEQLVIRFDLPVNTNRGASYSRLEDLIHLRPFSNDEEKTQVAAGLLHEYTHYIQDMTAEQLLRAGREPLEHPREQELRKETEARRHEVYLTRLMGVAGYSPGFHEELSAGIFLGQFETERTGSPREQARARREIRQKLEQAYATQLSTNAPARNYLIEIRSDRHAILIRQRGVETDLGEIPQRINTVSALNELLDTRVNNLTDRASLFNMPGGGQLAVAIFVVFDGNTKVGEFGIRP